jgi:hypothetical protein
MKIKCFIKVPVPYIKFQKKISVRIIVTGMISSWVPIILFFVMKF